MKYTLEYRSNNSGGSWWLSDKDWKAMEVAGWEVNWYKDDPRPYTKGDRFLGALATSAKIQTDDPEATISEWESITGQNRYDEGCDCCGQPHGFSTTDNETGEWDYLS